MSSLSLPLSLPTLSRSSPSPSPSSHRSHALSSLRPLLFLVLLLFPSTIAAPFYNDVGEEYHADRDRTPPFETDGPSSGSSSRSSDTPSVSLPRPSTTARTETITDRSIRTENITPQSTVLTPHFVSVLHPSTPHPTLLTLELSTTTLPEPNPTNSQEDNKSLEMFDNLSKKLETKQTQDAEISITFSPDEVKKLQEALGAMKQNFEITRRQLMVPDGPVKISDLNNDAKQQKSEKIYHEEETVSSTLAPEGNITVIDEATLPPTDSIPDDLVLTEAESSDQEEGEQVIDEGLEESIRPALCKLNTEDEVISVIWMLLQARIREWGYDEEQSTILALTAFGLLLDSEQNTLIETDEPGFIEDLKAGIQCMFRDCTLAMPTRKVPVRVLNEQSSPKMKREASEYHSDLFECRCPKGYVFV